MNPTNIRMTRQSIYIFYLQMLFATAQMDLMYMYHMKKSMDVKHTSDVLTTYLRVNYVDQNCVLIMYKIGVIGVHIFLVNLK